MLAKHRHASETPFKWRFAGGLMMDRLQWFFGAFLPPPPPPSSIEQKKQKNNNKNTQKQNKQSKKIIIKTTTKNVVKVGHPLANLSGSAHDLRRVEPDYILTIIMVMLTDEHTRMPRIILTKANCIGTISNESIPRAIISCYNIWLLKKLCNICSKFYQ